MSYPDFQDMVRFHSDPEEYVKSTLTVEDEVLVRDRMNEGLRALRQD